LGCVLTIFGLAIKVLKENRIRRYFKSILGDTEIQDALKALRTLVEQEGQLVGTMTLNKSITISEDVRYIQKQFDEAAEAILMSDILTWLCAPDSSPNFNTAYEAQQECPETGGWLIDDERYQRWKTEPRSCLWIHGKAGSGKTVLSSRIINDVQNHVDSLPHVGFAYFYFNFRSSETRDYRNLVRSLIGQLAEGHAKVPEALSNLHKRHSGIQQKPTIESLRSVLSSMFSLFNAVFVVIDALDECDDHDRRSLLKFLESMMAWPDCNFHVLLTSRRESDIEATLNSCVSHVVDLSHHVHADIHRYLRHVLDDERFCHLLDEDKDMVEECLSMVQMQCSVGFASS